MEPFAMLEAVLRHAPVGLALWDGDLRWRRLNGHLAEIHGIPVEDHVGRTAPELLGALGEGIHARLAQVLASGEPLTDVEVSGEIPATPGRVRHWRVSYFPVVDATGRQGVGAVVLETTRERAARDQAEALVEAAAALAASVRPAAVLEALAQSAVGRLADWCAIHVARPAGPELVALAHSDPAREDLARELSRRYPPRPGDPAGAAGVIQTGAPTVLEVIGDDDLPTLARDAEHLRLLRALEVRSAAILPLTARGVTLGALTLVFGASGRRYSSDLVATAEALAAHAALALDNATLYSEQASVAHVLQRSLLPAELPVVPGIELAARYRPAGRVNAVGGDFYGIWPDERGAWRIVVGDVTGKGAAAATLTGLVRHTLHAGTLRGDGIASELTLANDVLLSQPGAGRYCTALYGRLEPPNGGARLELVSAGHPPPLVRRADGTVAEVPVRGSLLGLERGMRYDPVAVELGAGDLLLLYTDGATELRGLQVPEGDAALRRMLRDHGDASPTELLEAIEHHALVQSEGSPRDDIALLALRCEP